MKPDIVRKKLEKVYEKLEKGMKSEGMVFLIEDERGSFLWKKETGNLKSEKAFMIASVTKMYTLVVALNFVDEGLIALDDRISKYLDKEILKGIHIYKGIEYSDKITIRHLLSHTSGLPDYYTTAPKGKLPIEEELCNDREFLFEEILERVKAQKAKFIPGKNKKGYYSDINFDIIGKIIEKISLRSLEENYNKYIYEPLGLINTYLFKKEMEYNIPEIYFKGNMISVPKILSSSTSSGGIVSTSEEMMIFLKAFWNGRLFKRNHYNDIRNYNRIQFYPGEYGLGNMRFKVWGAPEMIGHLGSTGVICFYIPNHNIYITGCINEVGGAKPIRMLIKLVNCFK